MAALLLPIKFKEGAIYSPTEADRGKEVVKSLQKGIKRKPSPTPDASIIKTWRTCQQLCELIEDGERFAYGSWRQWSLASARRRGRRTSSGELGSGTTSLLRSLPDLPPRKSQEEASSSTTKKNPRKRPASHLVECDCGMNLPGSEISFVDTPKDYLSPPSAGAFQNAMNSIGESSNSIFATANGRSTSDLDLEQWLSMPLDLGFGSPRPAGDAGMTNGTSMIAAPSPRSMFASASPAAEQSEDGRKAGAKGKSKAIPITCGRVGGCGAENCCLSGLAVPQRSSTAKLSEEPSVPTSEESAASLRALQELLFPESQSPASQQRNTTNSTNTLEVNAFQAMPASSCASSSMELVLPPAVSTSTLAGVDPFNMQHRPSLAESPISSAPGMSPASRPTPVQMSASASHQQSDPPKVRLDRPQCTNCDSFKTPLWRRDPENRLLCNACGLYQKLHKKPRPKVLKSAFQHHPDCLAPSSHPCQTLGCRFEPEENPTICTNCGTSTTPLWRKDEKGNPNCNACGLWRSLHGTARPVNMRVDHIRKRQRADDRRVRKNSAISLTGTDASEQLSSKAEETSIPSTPVSFQGVSFADTLGAITTPSTPAGTAPFQQTPSSGLSNFASMNSGIPILAHPTPHGIALQCPHTGQAWFFPNTSQGPQTQGSHTGQEEQNGGHATMGTDLSSILGTPVGESTPQVNQPAQSGMDWSPQSSALPSNAVESTITNGNQHASINANKPATPAATVPQIAQGSEDEASKWLQGSYLRLRKEDGKRAATAKGKLWWTE